MYACKRIEWKTISICIVHVNFFLFPVTRLPFHNDSFWPHSDYILQACMPSVLYMYIIEYTEIKREEITDRPNYVTNMTTSMKKKIWPTKPIQTWHKLHKKNIMQIFFIGLDTLMPFFILINLIYCLLSLLQPFFYPHRTLNKKILYIKYYE